MRRKLKKRKKRVLTLLGSLAALSCREIERREKSGKTSGTRVHTGSLQEKMKGNSFL